jgi:thioredoxin-related protein
MIRHSRVTTLAMATYAMLGLAILSPAQDRESKETSESVQSLLKTMAGSDRTASYKAGSELAERLHGGGPGAQATAHSLLERKAEFVSEPSVAKLLDELAGQGKPVLAAELLLRIAGARQTIRNFKRGHVVVGRLVVEDGKQDPEMVMAQMPILAEGYFAGEVGDLARPSTFRSHGYQNLDVPLEGKTGDPVYLGTVTLKPLPKEEAASLKGKVILDVPRDPEPATVKLSIFVGPVNTPHNGYSPRRRWPEPIEIPVSKAGEFTATGLSPARYYFSVAANGHVDSSRFLTFKPGQQLDAGTINLRSTDLGFYIGKPAPKVKELAWEKDFPTARKKAEAEKRPLLVMMTATWCGPCKLLEKETLSDPWIRHFLSEFVLVKASEDKEVEEQYGQQGYPTLVFTDSSGKAASKTVGYQPPLSFSGECVKAFQKLGLQLPADLQSLVDKKVISLQY